MDSLGVQQREAVPGAGGGTHGSQRERERRGASGGNASGGGGESASEQRQIQSSRTRYLSNLRARNPVDTCSQNNQMYASNFVKKNHLVCPTLKYRYVTVSSHRDTVPLNMGQSKIRGFSRSTQENLLLNEKLGGHRTPPRIESSKKNWHTKFGNSSGGKKKSNIEAKNPAHRHNYRFLLVVKRKA
jgi:hypothetical protein